MLHSKVLETLPKQTVFSSSVARARTTQAWCEFILGKMSSASLGAREDYIDHLSGRLFAPPCAGRFLGNTVSLRGNDKKSGSNGLLKRFVAANSFYSNPI